MGKLGAALLVLFCLGCDSGNGEATAQNDCRDFIATSYCPKAVTCLAAQDQPTCVSAAQNALDCSHAVGENADPGVCRTALADDSCSSLVIGGNVVLPASCVGLFQLSP